MKQPHKVTSRSSRGKTTMKAKKQRVKVWCPDTSIVGDVSQYVSGGQRRTRRGPVVQLRQPRTNHRIQRAHRTRPEPFKVEHGFKGVGEVRAKFVRCPTCGRRVRGRMYDTEHGYGLYSVFVPPHKTRS